MPSRVTRKHVLLGVWGMTAGVVLFWFLGGICYGHESGGASGRGGLLDFEGSRYKTTFGPKQFYLRKGQTFVVEYRATVRAGELRIHLFKPFGTIGLTGPSRHLSSTGAGEYTVTVPESGFYKLVIDHMGGKHDYEYTAKWYAR
jgi:hypothetical protein